MKKPDLTFPELAFVIMTRAALGAGVGLLLSTKLNDQQRKLLGLTLVLVGAVTTIPAALAATRGLRGSRDASDAE
jgi:hypothetical protein